MFYGNDLSIVTSKLVFSRVLYDGTMANGSLLSINFLELFDLLNFRGMFGKSWNWFRYKLNQKYNQFKFEMVLFYIWFF